MVDRLTRVRNKALQKTALYVTQSPFLRNERWEKGVESRTMRFRGFPTRKSDPKPLNDGFLLVSWAEFRLGCLIDL